MIPYLTEEQVASLAEGLHEQKSFRFWIAEYFSPQMYRYFRTKERTEQMRNAPFRFFPPDWFGFFKAHGWVPREVAYLPEEAEKLGRAMPLPWWARLLIRLTPKDKMSRPLHLAGYAVYIPT